MMTVNYMQKSSFKSHPFSIKIMKTRWNILKNQLYKVVINEWLTSEQTE